PQQYFACTEISGWSKLLPLDFGPTSPNRLPAANELRALYNTLVDSPFNASILRNHLDEKRVIENHLLFQIVRKKTAIAQLRKNETLIQGLPGFKMFVAGFRVKHWLCLNGKESCHRQSPIKNRERLFGPVQRSQEHHTVATQR